MKKMARHPERDLSASTGSKTSSVAYLLSSGGEMDQTDGTEELSYEIIDPSQPSQGEDDLMRLVWDTEKGRWCHYYSFFGSAGWGEEFGPPLSDRACEVLLYHFGLTEQADEYPAEKLISMSPDTLRREGC